MRPDGVLSAAETRMKRPWMKRRDDARSRLLFTPEGEIQSDRRNDAKAPSRKDRMETRVVSHALGFAGRPEALRPRITVLPAERRGKLDVVERMRREDIPVCIPTKTPQLLNAAASTRPVTRQHASSAKSPRSFSMGPKIRAREKNPGCRDVECFIFS